MQGFAVTVGHENYVRLKLVRGYRWEGYDGEGVWLLLLRKILVS